MRPIIYATALIAVAITCSLSYAGETARIEVDMDSAPVQQVQTVLQTYAPTTVQNTIRYEDRVRTIQVPTTVMVDQEITEKWAIIEQLVQQPQLQTSYSVPVQSSQVSTVCLTCPTGTPTVSTTSTDVSIGTGRRGLLQRIRDRRSKRDTNDTLGATSVNVQVGCRRCRL